MVTLFPPIAICGNGVTEPGEHCDDANLVDGDGCDSNCTPTGCGNGIVSAGEVCDDEETDTPETAARRTARRFAEIASPSLERSATTGTSSTVTAAT